MKKRFLLMLLSSVITLVSCSAKSVTSKYAESVTTGFLSSFETSKEGQAVNLVPVFDLDQDRIPALKHLNNDSKNQLHIDRSKLSTSERSWYFNPKNDGTTPGEPQDVLDLIKKYSAYYVGDTTKKVIYLTFDEGYENGYTGKILDVLKKHDVKAAFFVVKPYITSNKNLVKRMVEEGHTVSNHSVNHPSMALVTDLNKFNNEFYGVEESYKELTGKEMPRFFRPPMGKYSELSLSDTQTLGYKTIFWSFAYDDWDPNKQPNQEYAKKIILQRTHNGAIFLLHAVSKTNAEILDYLLTEWKSRGFEFKSLDELPE